MPAVPQADLSPKNAEALVGAVGQAHYDLLLAAHGGSYVLLSDDHLFRRVAADHFSVPGVWTQAFLMWALERKWLSFQEYTTGVATLAQWRYTFTSVSAEVLALVAASSDAGMLERFRTLAAQLNLAHNSLPNLVQVTVVFLIKLWSSSWNTAMKERLTYALLNGIAPQSASGCHQFLRRLIASATIEDAAPGAVLCVLDWTRGHFLWDAFRHQLDD